MFTVYTYIYATKKRSLWLEDRHPHKKEGKGNIIMYIIYVIYIHYYIYILMYA